MESQQKKNKKVGQTNFNGNNSLYRIIKDEVMIYFYNTSGDLEKMKKADTLFDRLFIELKINLIILGVTIFLSLIIYVFMFFFFQNINTIIILFIGLAILIIIRSVLDAFKYKRLQQFKEEKEK